MTEETLRLSMHGIAKRYGAVRAIRNSARRVARELIAPPGAK